MVRDLDSVVLGGLSVLLIVLSSCNNDSRAPAVNKSSLYNEGNIEYPYVAKQERWNQIETQFLKVGLGASLEEVIALLGKPDEILPLYEPRYKRPKQLGYQYYYILRRGNRGRKDIDQAHVRVGFDTSHHVIFIDKYVTPSWYYRMMREKEAQGLLVGPEE